MPFLNDRRALYLSPYPQKVEGKVRSGGSALGLAYVFTIGQAGVPVTGTIADDGRNSSLNTPTGTYSLVAAKSGFLADMNTAPSVTVGVGATATQDLSISPADRSIAGRLVVTGGFSGLGRVQIVSQAEDAPLLAIGFTDAEGYFNLATSSQATRWRVEPSYRVAVMLG